jgi:hypothetical protein
MPEVDFLPIAVSGSSVVDSQGTYAGSGYQLNGFSTGITLTASMNKALRQGTVMAAALANWVSGVLNQAVLDNGNVTTLTTQIGQAIAHVISSASTPVVVSVSYSATPTFNASGANPIQAVFQMTLTGNVTSSTFLNGSAGQTVIFILKQDSVGGHTFVGPSGIYFPNISTAASTISVASFIIDASGGFYATAPMSVSP